MKLYHYCCEHSAEGIRRDGELRGMAHPLMPSLGPLIWLTDLDVPERNALGLTSRILKCDRTRVRVTVDAEAEHWPVFARTVPREARYDLESAFGVLPMHWYVALTPIIGPEILEIAP